jgi:hypothetical protein
MYPVDHDSVAEQFVEHIIIALSFFLIGILFCIFMIIWFRRHKIKIDQDLDEGTTLRVYDKKGKKWIIANPTKVVDYIDTIIFSFFDKGYCSDSPIRKQDAKYARIIRRTLIIFTCVIGYSGVILIFSALEVNLNVIDYMTEYIKHVIYKIP